MKTKLLTKIYRNNTKHNVKINKNIDGLTEQPCYLISTNFSNHLGHPAAIPVVQIVDGEHVIHPTTSN